eukprot:Skav201491  [mRNA]  locus=scaffold828:274694:277975:- [translate_table: standard]
MQRDRSRSRDSERHEDHDVQGSDDDLSDPDARSSTNRTESEEENIITWTFFSRDSMNGRLDLPESQATPTRMDAARALFCSVDDIASVHPVQQLQDREDNLVMVIRTEEPPVPRDHMVCFVEVMCLHDQPVGGIPRPPTIHQTIWMLPAHCARDDFVQTLRLAALVNAYPWFVTIEHNGIVWETFDQRSRRFQHGDFLLVRLAPHQTRDHRAQLTDWLLDANIGLWDSLISYAPNSPEAQPSLSPNLVILPETPQESQPCQPFTAFGGLSVHSWYISHTRHNRCPMSRLLTLAPDPNTWARDIETLWEDVMEKGAIFSMHWVMPQPLALHGEPREGLPHMIIEQHNCYRQISTLITTQVMRRDEVVHHRVAVSMPELTTAESYQIATTNEFQCATTYECEVTIFGRPVDLRIPARRPSGLSVLLVMTPRNRDPADEGSLMQTKTHLPRPQTLEAGKYELQQLNQPLWMCSPHEHPNSPTDAPENQHPPAEATGGADRLSQRQIEFTRARTQFGALMQLAWAHDSAVELREEGPVLYIRTYFVSPLRMTHCYVSRAVRLTLPMEEWQQHILDAWRDMVDPAHEVNLYVVMPKPPDTVERRGNGAYVILAQHLGQNDRAVLLTTVEGPSIAHMATIVSPDATRRELLVQAGQYPRCFNMDQLLQCSVSHGGTVVRDDVPTPVSNGYGFMIVILQMPSYMRQDISHVAPVPHPDAEGDPNATDHVNPSSRQNAPGAPSQPPQPPEASGSTPAPRVMIDFAPVFRERAFLMNIPIPILTQWPTEVQIPPAILQQILAYPVWDQNTPPMELQIYTDGSAYKDGHPGSSAVLFVCTQTGWHLGGILATASEGHCALHGEHSAMIWALIWTLKITQPLTFKPQVTFVFDALITGKQTFEDWQSRAHPGWWIIIRSLHHCLHSQNIPVNWMHTYAHQGTFGNEVADLAAKVATQKAKSPEDPIRRWLNDANARCALQWIWLLPHFEQQHASLPPMINQKLIHTIQDREVKPHQVANRRPVSPAEPIPNMVHQLRIATANVLSLKSTQGKPGTCAGARQLSLATIFHQEQMHIVCLQETRHLRTPRQVDHYLVIDHPASQRP